MSRRPASQRRAAYAPTKQTQRNRLLERIQAWCITRKLDDFDMDTAIRQLGISEPDAFAVREGCRLRGLGQS